MALEGHWRLLYHLIEKVEELTENRNQINLRSINFC